MGCAPSISIRSSKTGPCSCSCHKKDKSLKLPKIPKREQLIAESFKDDPRIPLSGRQVYLLQKSWKAVARNMVSTGINMFLSLFEMNDNVKMYFGKISKNATLSELRESGVLEDHARTVMLTIDEAMMSMNDADMLIGMLKHIAKTHLRIAQFDPQVFWLIREPFLLAIKETLEDRYSAHLAEIYKKAISFILATLIEGFIQGKQLEENGNHISSTDDRPD